MKRVFLFLISLLLLAGLDVMPAVAASPNLNNYFLDGSLIEFHRLMPTTQIASLVSVVPPKVSLDSGNGQAQLERESDPLLPEATNKNLIAEESDAGLGIRGLITPRRTTCRPPRTCQS
jgi:hypothetical protein